MRKQNRIANRENRQRAIGCIDFFIYLIFNHFTLSLLCHNVTLSVSCSSFDEFYSQKMQCASFYVYIGREDSKPQWARLHGTISTCTVRFHQIPRTQSSFSRE